MERNWNSTIAITALSDPIRKTQMKESFVMEMPFLIKHIVIMFHVLFVQYPSWYHVLYILIANDFVFHGENVVINFYMYD